MAESRAEVFPARSTEIPIRTPEIAVDNINYPATFPYQN